MDQQLGRYRILEEIAAGAQGTVYRGYDPEGGQIIALKVLHPTLSGDRTYIERFRREASLAASIDHPNVVKIFEVGQDGDRFFMALEFLPESLARVIQGVGQLRIEGAAQYGVQIADGLAAAHALGIVHRDVKPQNVLIGPDGTAKVTDFGIARAESLATMTATGVVMGTPHYMSPEQSRGERADARSDVYSLGCMVYQMLAGEVPFKGDTPLAVIRQQIDEQPRRLRELRRDLPRRLEAVVERSMAKDPGRRFQSTAEMGQALRDAVPGLAGPARAAAPRPRLTPPTPPPQPAPRPELAPQQPSRTWMSAWAGAWQRSHRRRWAWVGTLLSVTVALTVAGVRLDVYGQARDYVEEAGWFGGVVERPAPIQPEPAAVLIPTPTPTPVLVPAQTPAPAELVAATTGGTNGVSAVGGAPSQLPGVGSQAAPTPVPLPTATAAPVATLAPAASPGGPTYGGVLQLSLNRDPFSDGFSPYPNLNGVKALVNSLIFSRLFRKDQDSSEFEGDLAESWEVSADGRTWIVRLREDALFHDGSPVTATDVQQSIESMVESSGRFFQGLAEAVTKISVVDDLTVVINTREPFAPFMDVLASAWATIAPVRTLASEGSAEVLVGSGPFQVLEYRPGESLLVGRNPDYYRQPPYLDGVRFFVVSERTSRLAAFLAGRLDFAGAATGSGLDPSALEQIRQNESAVLFKSAAVAPALRFDTQNPPFDDVRVRRAVALAIDRHLWDIEVNQGLGRPEFPIPSLYFPELAHPESAVERTLAYDPVRAESLLAEAGFPDGLRTVLYVWSEQYVFGAKWIVELLSQVGIQVELRLEERAVLTERLLGEDGYQGMFFGPTSGVSFDIDGFLAANFLPGGFANYSRIRDRELEAFFRAQRSETDQQKRRAIVAELERYIFESQTYLVPMPSVRQVQAHSFRVQGFRFQPGLDLGAMLEAVWIGDAAPSPTTAVEVASPTRVPVPTATAVAAIAVAVPVPPTPTPTPVPPTPTPSTENLAFMVDESGWVTQFGQTGTGATHPPQAGDFNNNAPVRGFLSFDITSIPSDAIVSSSALILPDPEILGEPFPAFGSVKFEAVWYGLSLTPNAYDTSGYLVLQNAFGQPSGRIGVTAGIRQAISLGYERFQIRFAFAASTDQDGSADEYIIRQVDRAGGDPILEVVYDDAAPAAGPAIQVTSTVDSPDENPGDGICDDGSGSCTLRAAIMEANARAGVDVIQLPPGIYTLTTGSELEILSSLTINGSGAISTIVEASVDAATADHRVLNISGGMGTTVLIDGVTIRHGNGIDAGGGVFSNARLTLTNSTVSDNSVRDSGGGIFSSGPGAATFVVDSTIRNNKARFGGGIEIRDGGTLNLTRSTISANFVFERGGGIFMTEPGTTLSITDSNISGNTGESGGGIYNDGQVVTISNSTVSGNTGGFGVGGIYNDRGGTLIVSNGTISANRGGGILSDGNVELVNSIIASNFLDGDCFGSFTSLGHNLDSDGTCNLTDPTDLPNANPLLGPLQDNGGPTETHALLAGSPAIDAGDAAAAPATDQRGVPRPRGAASDIGSFESPFTPTPTPTAIPTATPRPTATAVPPTATPPPPTSTPEPAVFNTTIVNFAHTDASVSVGTTIIWENQDAAPHTTTSGVAPDASGLWDSGTLSLGQTFQFTFDRTGEFQFFCSIHPFMTATITVTE